MIHFVIVMYCIVLYGTSNVWRDEILPKMVDDGEDVKGISSVPDPHFICTHFSDKIYLFIILKDVTISQCIFNAHTSAKNC